MEIGDYVRDNDGLIWKIKSIKKEKIISTTDWNVYKNEIIKSSPGIIELLEPMDLMYVDIDNGYEGGIIVPRIAETQNELNEYIEKFKNGTLILSGVVTREQLERGVYWL